MFNKDDYYKKYLKYKNDYNIMKRNNNYKFLTFDNLELQGEFIRNNLKRIVDLTITCFNSNINDPINNQKYYDINKNIIHNFRNKTKWFFVMNDDNIIGICYEFEPEIFYSDKKIETYKIINLNAQQIKKLKSNIVDVDKYIGGFCKNPEYKMVGSFLLNELSKYYKSIGIKIFHLTPESTIYKSNYDAFIKGNGCIIENNSYLTSNNNLIRYYEKNGFVINKHLYEIVECNNSNNYILLNVMYKYT